MFEGRAVDQSAIKATSGMQLKRAVDDSKRPEAAQNATRCHNLEKERICHKTETNDLCLNVLKWSPV
jgi:hypothetical protein